MENLFIWFNRAKLSKGFPVYGKFILKDSFDANKPKSIPDQYWTLFNYSKMGYPPNENKYKFPQNMYMVILNKQNEILFDYYDHEHNVKIISEKLLKLLLENGLKDGYETANLNIIDQNGNLLTNEKYFALRLYLFDDDLFEFNKETKKSWKTEFGSSERAYPDIKLKDENCSRSIFFIKEFSYRNSIIFKENVLAGILNNFYLPEIYKIRDFPFVLMNVYNYTILPNDNKYKIRN